MIQGIKKSDYRPIEEPQVVTLLDEIQPEEEILEEEPEILEEVEYFEEQSVDVPELEEFAQDDFLGLDSEASAGFDQFNLVAKKGAADLLSIGGKAGIKYDLARVKNLIEQRLHASFNSNDQLKSKVYSVVVKFWIDKNGFVEQVQVVDTTGDQQLDYSIEQALKNIPPFTSRILDVPQPIKIRIFTRNYAS